MKGGLLIDGSVEVLGVVWTRTKNTSSGEDHLRANWYEFIDEFRFVTPEWLVAMAQLITGRPWALAHMFDQHGRHEVRFRPALVNMGELEASMAPDLGNMESAQVAADRWIENLEVELQRMGADPMAVVGNQDWRRMVFLAIRSARATLAHALTIDLPNKLLHLPSDGVSLAAGLGLYLAQLRKLVTSSK